MDQFRSINSEEGSFQNKRLPDTLSKNYIHVDERKLPELLIALTEYAKNIKFYNLDGNVNGNWHDLLFSNDAILLASTIPVNQTELKRLFYNESSKGLRQAINENLRHIKTINNWFNYAKKFERPEGKDLHNKVRKMVRINLSVAVVDLLKFNQVYNKLAAFNIDNLDSSWGIDSENMRRDSLNIFSSRQQKEERLAAIFNAILNVLIFLSSESETALKKSLSDQCHSPAAGLILAFLETYTRSQVKINSFSERMLEFYYNHIQKNRAKGGMGDKVFIKCQLNADTDPVIVAKGTLFSAGKSPDLQDILYEMSDDASISGAKPGALKTIYLQRHLLISPENFTRSVTRIKSSDVFDHFEKKGDSIPHSLFGYDDGGSGFSIGEDSDIGLVIFSRILKLKEGHRRISLEFSITDKYLEDFYTDNEIRKALMQLEAVQIEISKEGSNKGVKSQQMGKLVSKLSVIFGGKFEMLAGNNQNKKLASVIYEMFKTVSSSIWKDCSYKKIISGLYQKSLIALLINANNKKMFVSLYHQILCQHIFGKIFINKKEISNILDKANILFSDEHENKKIIDKINRDISASSRSLFFYYFSNAFVPGLTTESGWQYIERYALALSPDNNGFSLSFDIKKSMPEIVDFDQSIHGADYLAGQQQSTPVLMIRINPDARVFPYSYLQVFDISRIKLKVEVQGLKSLIVQNDHGPVDKSRPFQPFGPVPVQGSSCYIGGHEFAQKNISRLVLNIRWKNLPGNYGGFSSYYEGYGEKVCNSDFKVNLSFSSAGSWVPGDIDQQQSSLLFDELPETASLLANRCINVNLRGHYPTLDSRVDENQYIDMNHLKNGYLKLSLSTGNSVFGHKSYPGIMGNILTLNAKNKKQIDLPEQPYTPEIESMSVDYSAEEFINLNISRNTEKNRNIDNKRAHSSAISVDKSQVSGLYYMTPLGIEQIHEEAAVSGMSFFPKWLDDGNLYIAFKKSDKTDNLNIYIQLKNDSTHGVNDVRQRIRISYYSASGWQTLDQSNLLSDSTNDLMHSGIINIKLPNNISCHPGIEPVSHFWLRFSSSCALSAYSSIQSLSFDALSLHSVSDKTKLSSSGDGMSSSWRAAKDIPGIQSYQQVQAAFSNHDAEDRQQSVIRFYERLRHRNRAINAWDYERLVLEKFPQLHMVKCFPATSSTQLRPAPGHVLLIVVPDVADNVDVHTQGHLVSSDVLQEIAEYIRALMPANVHLEVRNPAYENIQIRCAVSFIKNSNTGQLVSMLNRAISEYVSPWSEEGYDVKFGWTMRKKDIESYIISLPYVDDVARFSLVDIINVSNRPEKFRLIDSAAAENIQSTVSVDSNRYSEGISAMLPWSLAIPAKLHYIEIINDGAVQNRDPQPVGINNLRIGNTFIIEKAKGKGISSNAIT